MTQDAAVGRTRVVIMWDDCPSLQTENERQGQKNEGASSSQLCPLIHCT